MLLKAAMPFNFSSPEYLSNHRTRKNRVSPVSPAHMNSPLEEVKLVRARTCKKRITGKQPLVRTELIHVSKFKPETAEKNSSTLGPRLNFDMFIISTRTLLFSHINRNLFNKKKVIELLGALPPLIFNPQKRLFHSLKDRTSSF